MNTNTPAEKPAKKKELAEELLWEGPEYDFWEKDSSWFLLFGTIAVLLIILSLLLANYFLALIIFLGAFILGSYARRAPKNISFGLTKTGIKHGDTIFHYDTIRSFWIDEKRDRLVIESGRLVKPHIHLPVNKNQSEKVKTLLASIIKEEEQPDSLTDFVTEFFGF